VLIWQLSVDRCQKKIKDRGKEKGKKIEKIGSKESRVQGVEEKKLKS